MYGWVPTQPTTPPSAHLLSLSVTQRIEARTRKVSSVVIFKLRPKGKAGVGPLK